MLRPQRAGRVWRWYLISCGWESFYSLGSTSPTKFHNTRAKAAQALDKDR